MTQQGFIGFDGVRFEVLTDSDREAVYQDWDQPHREATFEIYNSNITVVQHGGAGLATWRARLGFPDLETYFALKAKQTATGVLTLYAGYTSARGEQYHLAGEHFEDLDQVELVRLGPARIAVGHQWIEAEGLFRRPMDPLTGRAS